MERIWEKFKRHHERFHYNNVKKCGISARKNINELRKLSAEYRMINLKESKTHE